MEPWCRRCGAGLDYGRAHGAGSAQGPRGRALVISGTCASGKTTLSHLLARDRGFVQIDGDWLLRRWRDRLGHSIDFNEIQPEIFALADGITALGRDVVVAHVILPDRIPQYRRFLGEAGIPHRIVILMPQVEVLLARNEARECWFTEQKWIMRFHNALLDAPPEIVALYHDNSNESPGETVARLIESLSASDQPDADRPRRSL